MKDKIAILNSNGASLKDEVVENLHRYNSEPFCLLFCAFIMKRLDLAEEVMGMLESTRWDGLKSLFSVICFELHSKADICIWYMHIHTWLVLWGSEVALATSSLTYHSSCSPFTLSLGHSSSTALFAFFKYYGHSCFLSNWDSGGRHFYKNEAGR